MAQQMGWGDSFGLVDGCFKRKNRWLLTIPDISAEGINSLPPSKASRPSLSFKELSLEHLNETIYFPGKPEWKPITLTLYDMAKPTHKIWEWIYSYYDLENDKFKFSVGFKKPEARLTDKPYQHTDSSEYKGMYPSIPSSTVRSHGCP